MFHIDWVWYTFNPSTEGAKAGRPLRAQRLPGLQRRSHKGEQKSEGEKWAGSKDNS